MTKLLTINCRICQGQRPTNGEVCLGCGTRIERAQVRETVPKPKIKCPACGNTGPHSEPDEGRYCCRQCLTFFEEADGRALDDRPEENLLKQERLTELRKKQSRQRRFR